MKFTNPGGPDCTPSPPCPALLPADGGACAPDNLRCPYTANPTDPADYICFSTATCSTGAWTASVRTSCPSNNSECPSNWADAGKCSGPTVRCGYSDGTSCVCSNCSGGGAPVCGGPYTFRCKGPNTTPGCPPILGTAGMPCCPTGLVCVYPGVYCNGQVGTTSTCTDGGWLQAKPPQICPT